MSSKKLESILRGVPSATSKTGLSSENRDWEKTGERIVAVVPSGLKRQIKQYIVDHPGETERTIIIKGLISLGFKIDAGCLSDRRGRR